MANNTRPRPAGLTLSRLLAAFLVVVLWPISALAHSVGFTMVSATFSADGRYQVDLFFDLDALLAETDPGHLDGAGRNALLALPPKELKQRMNKLRSFLAASVRLRFADKEATPRMDFPEMQAAKGSTAAPLPGSLVRFSGRIPSGQSEFTFQASPFFGPTVLTLRQGDSPLDRQVLIPGDTSRPYRIAGGGPPPSSLEVALQYMHLGFSHIIPLGVDHILFVLGLYLLNTTLRPLLYQVTAFTVAHSISLALSMYRIISLPSAVVEPLIALSIVFIAMENLFTSQLKPWRPAVVFAFGLLHGLGFAGALGELGLPPARFALALFTFNVGVELGQIAVLAGAFLLTGWFRARRWYRPALILPASAAIACIGLYWAVQRTFFI
ncbi:MAG: HupE/UreJ family protein [Acidobacteriota bacterium]